MQYPPPWTEVSPIGDLLIKGAHRHPERLALIFPQSRATFGELYQGALRIAQGLLAQGIKPGEHVGLLASNCIEFMEAFFGVTLLGAIVVPLNARHKSTEQGFVIRDADLVAVLTQADASAHVDFAALLCEALPGLSEATNVFDLRVPSAPKLRQVILIAGESRSGFLGFADFQRSADSTTSSQVLELSRRVSLRSVAAILYTSGTTSNPKGCMLSHEALSRGSVERAAYRLAVEGDNVHWGAGPLFHLGSLAPAIGAIGAGHTYVGDLFFDAPRAVALLRDHRVTSIWPWFLAIVLRLLEQPDFDDEHLPDVRRILVGVSSAAVERLQHRFPAAEIVQASGMTETAGPFAISAPDDTADERAQTFGKVYSGLEIRIIHQNTNSDLSAGEAGELLVRGYSVMEGYYNDREKTAAALDSDGWLHTGDLFVQTHEGNVVYNGRLKDMLKVGGENVAAVEVESFLQQHPAVRIAEVVGKPDSRLEEVPVVFLELHEHTNVTSQEIIDFCKGRIANYKVPREVLFMKAGDWPMSLTKIDKRELRKLVSNKLIPGSSI